MGDTSLSHSALLSTLLCKPLLRNKTSTSGVQSAISLLLPLQGLQMMLGAAALGPAAHPGWKPTAPEVCRAEPQFCD